MPVYKLATPNFDEHSIIVNCACGAEHDMRFCYYDEPDDWELIVSVHLKRSGFLGRLWKAIRYVFGYRCRYGEWDELLIDRKDAREIIAFLQDYSVSLSADE